MPHFPFQKTTSAVLAAAYLNLVFPVVPAYALITESSPQAESRNRAPDFELPAPVRTPKQVKINRTVPAGVTAAAVKPTFPADPTVADLFRARVFAEPFVPAGKSAPTQAENRALAEAIDDYITAKGASAEPFEQFLRQYPDSSWSASIHLNLGLQDFSGSWFTRAIGHYEAAWQASREAGDARGRAVADRAFSELAMMYARVGRKDTLEQLFAGVGSRQFTGNASELITAAREGLALMTTHPELAYRCGPGALDRILARKNQDRGFNTFLFDIPSTDKGTSLASVAGWAAKANLDLQPAFREPGAKVLTPAVVHWKLGHYAALFGYDGENFQVEDPTFGARMTATVAALDAEASGYYLVPAGNLPAGWRSVSAEEAASVWGKGSTASVDSNPTGPDAPKTPSPNDCRGMPVAAAHLSMVSLNITDTPVGYAPPVGPAVFFTITYNQREASQPSVPDYSNLGTKWVHNWLSFIDETVMVISSVNQATPKIRMPGGGTKPFTIMPDPGTYPVTFPKSKDASSLLKKTSATAYTLIEPDGSQLVFGRKVGASSPYRYFLTAISDPMGNTVTLGYDGQDRLVSITDAIGQVTTLDYDLLADDQKITKVTDPFGRYATIDYDGSGRLDEITDVLGLTSTFAYQSTSDFVNSMTTPYGTSTFAYGESGTGGRNRWLELTNPLGEIERIECRNDWSGLPGAGSAPTGMTLQTSYQNYRNTLYWDRKAYKEAYNSASPEQTGVTAGARIYHWLHTDDTLNAAAAVLDNEKLALETNRIWYNYPGQSSALVQGTTTKPSKVGRVLDDNTTQLYEYAYNSFDRVTSATDPLGRVTSYIYDANLIDLLEVRQKTGAGANDYEILGKATYNAAHQPLTVTDSAGQVTTFTYNSVGQVSTVTNAKSEVTKFFYNPTGDPAGSRLGGGARDPAATGYLVAVDGPVSGTGDESTFEYDGFGRVAIVTDTEGYVVETDYDSLDRPTLVTYPDATTQQIVYDKLDAVTVKDRSGRVTRTSYNAIRQPVASTDPLGRMTQFGWCKCGDLRLLIDAAGNQTVWTHDVQGRVSSKNFADGSIVRYRYENTTSRLKSVTDGKGQVTNYTYYKDNQLNQVSYTNATISTPSVTFTYDTIYPRVATMVDGVGTTTYGYHDIPDGPSATPGVGDGRLASIDGPWANDTIAYNYDELGRVVERTINTTANDTDISYDALGRVNQVINPLGTFTYGYVNHTGRLASIAYPNGQATNFDYWPNTAASAGNGDQRLKEIENLKPNTSNLSTFSYAYDLDGAITEWTRKYDAGSVLISNFTYDLADQLVGASVPSASSVLSDFVYRYDKAGNRTSEQIDNAVNAGTHNNLNQLKTLSATGPIRFAGSLNEAGTVTVNGQPIPVAGDNSFSGDVSLPPGSNSVAVVAKDPLDNTTTNNYTVAVASGTARTLTYDTVGNMTDNGAGQTYEWDAVNRLTKITYTGGARTEFTYDGLDRRVKIVEKNSGGSTTSEKRFVWDGMAIAEERDGSNAPTKRFYDQGVMVGSNEFYYTRDHLGSIREITDDIGATEARYDYDPYGRITKVSGSGDADFRYTGHFYHATSGLNLAAYRAYDAVLGRWLSRDPIEERGGINLYGYVHGNPFNAYDPLGLSWKGVVGGIVVGVVVGAAIGATVATGGLAAVVLAGMVSGVASNVAEQWIDKGSLACVDAQEAALSGVLGGAGGALGFGVGKVLSRATEGVDDLIKAAGGKVRGNGDIVVDGGSRRAKDLFRQFDAKGAGNRTVQRDTTGGGRQVVGQMGDGTSLRIRFKPDGTTRIQSGEQKFIFPK